MKQYHILKADISLECGTQSHIAYTNILSEKLLDGLNTLLSFMKHT